MGLFGSTQPPLPATPAADENPVLPPNPAQLFVPFPAVELPAIDLTTALETQSEIKVEDSEQSVQSVAPPVIAQPQQIEQPVSEPIVLTESAEEEPFVEQISTIRTSSSSALFPKQVTDQVEAMLQRSIEEEQHAIELERQALSAKQITIEQQKTQLETLRQSISAQEAAIQEQEHELALRTSQLESREGRVAKVMETLES